MASTSRNGGDLITYAPGTEAIRRIREWVQTGVLVPGLPLPSERVLAAKLEVSRKTVRRALASLARDGVLSSDTPRRPLIVSRPGTISPDKGIMEHSIALLAWPIDEDELRGKQQPGWTHTFMIGAFKEIRDQGYNLFLIHTDRLTEADLRRVIVGCPLGVVCPEANTESDSRIWQRALSQAGIPLAVYGNSPDVQTYDRVASDHDIGSYELTRWLLAQGRRRIAMFFAHGPGVYWVRGRRSGYERAMREAGLEPRPTIQFRDCAVSADSDEPPFENAYRHMAGYLAEHIGAPAGSASPDALLLESDGQAYAVAAACRLLGRTPGSDILLAGYDDYAMESWERRVEPCGPQVTIDKRNEEMGRELVRLLLDRCEGRLPPGPQIRLVAPALVVMDQIPPAPGNERAGAPLGASTRPTAPETR